MSNPEIQIKCSALVPAGQRALFVNGKMIAIEPLSAPFSADYDSVALNPVDYAKYEAFEREVGNGKA